MEDQRKAPWKSAYTELLGGVEPVQVHLSLEERQWVVRRREAKFVAETIVLAESYVNDLRDAAQVYLDGAKENAKSADKIARNMKWATWIIALSTTVYAIAYAIKG